MKRLISSFVILASVFTLFAQGNGYLLEVPVFMKGKYIQYGKNVQFGVKSDSFKIISLSAPVEIEKSAKKDNGNSEDIVLKKAWNSELLILNDSNEIVFKKKYPCHVWIDVIENKNKSLFMLTKTKIVGNNLIPFEIQFLSNEGKILQKIGNVNYNAVFKSVKNDCLVFNNMDVDYSRIFNIKPLNVLERKSKNLKTNVKAGNKKIEFQKPPTGFLMIGGNELDYIVSFNRVIWKTSFNTPGDYYWKIDDIGENIQQIYYLGFNYLGVETDFSFIVLNMNSGSEILSFNRTSDFSKDNKIIWRNTKFDKNNLILNSANNMKFEISKDKLIKNKNIEKLYAKVMLKQNLNDSKKCIEKETDENILQLFIEKNRLKLDIKPKKSIYKLEKKQLSLSNLIN